MEFFRNLDVLVINDTTVPFLEFRELFSSAPGISAFYATSLAEALHVFTHNTIHCVLLGASTGRRPRGVSYQRVLKEINPGIPILLFGRNRQALTRWSPRRLKKEGILERLTGPLTSPKILEAVYRAADWKTRVSTARTFQEQVLYSPLHAEEKLSLLQTALDILNHDTKDLFIRILAILSDIPESEYTGILSDYINELYECTSEALGFISSQKRLDSLVDIINSLRIGREKIPLPSQSRIELAYGPRKLLFIESSRLIKNALGNIIDNALKYSPPEQKIRLEISRRQKEILLKVIDRGIGIDEEERPLVFHRNYRSAKAAGFEGSGKGLWIAYNIIKEEHGDIFIEDNPEGGTIITVILPAFDSQRADRRLTDLSEWYKLPLEVVEKKARIMKTILLMEFPEYEADAESLVFANLLDHFRDERRKKERQKYFFRLQEFTRFNPNGTTVLLVDDSLYVHYTIAPLLADQGLKIVDFAFNGVEAFNLYQIFHPTLVIMDITMPMKSGIETAKDIFEINPQAKILFVTALGEYKPLLENLERLFAGRRYRLLSKPIRPPKLVAAVNALLRLPE